MSPNDSPNRPTPPDFSLTRHPIPRDIFVSLDLGSESTAAFVYLPGEREPRRIKLQHYLPAFAADPDLLTSARGVPSHRLRTRFFANEHFRTNERFEPRERPTHSEVLPPDHARLDLVDYAAFNAEAARAATKTDYARNLQRCFFRFVTSTQAPYDHSLLLPNAKLVFQTGADFSRPYRMEFESDQPTPDERIVRIHPIELISNQVCLVLENFVRHEPDVSKEEAGQGWERFAIVLTVPNTYSPFHRDLLKQLVEEKLEGAEVQIITESDAIVYYYIAEDKPNQDLDRMAGDVELYLTLDVGKGTTDLSLIVVGYDVRNGLVRSYETNAVSNGRASGGAKMTFRIAQFFESLMDKVFLLFLQAQPGAPALDRMPPRLTCQSLKQLRQDSTLTKCLLSFEQHCEAFKHGLQIVEGKLTAPDVGGSNQAVTVADYLTEAISSHMRNEARVSFEEGQENALRGLLTETLRHPMNVPDVEGPWETLQQQVNEYVEQNVDKVLLELINAHLKPNRSSFTNVKDALKLLMGSAIGGKSRTHFIVSGQGSRFAPLRDRLKELADQIAIPMIDEATLTKWCRGEVPESGKLQWWQMASRRMNKPQFRNVIVLLNDDRLKDGCALGALHWYMENPARTNPHAIGGQLYVRAQGGANPRPVDMDQLNEGCEIVLGSDYLGLQGAWEVYYLPCRGLDLKDADEIPTPILKLRDVSEIRFRNELGSVVIETNRGRHSLDPAIYDAANNERLRAMVWPNVLLPEEERS